MGYKIYQSPEYTNATSISSVTVDVSSGGVNTDANYGLLINNKFFAWNTSWQEVDGSYASLTSFANFNTNLPTAPLNKPTSSFRMIASVDDTLSSPETQILKWNTEYTKKKNAERKGCVVKMKVQESGDGLKEGAICTATLHLPNETNNVEWNGSFLDITTVTVTTNDEGYAEFELAPNAEIETNGTLNTTFWQIQVGNNSAKDYKIPINVPSVWLNDIV